MGIKYEEVTKVINQSNKDWKKFVSSTSKGINKRRQVLLQKAVKAFVYCVLGAQVQTRWPIMGDQATSLQTQVIFHKLVEETIAQSNNSVMITNIRAAISGSNVVLDIGIIPGVILIPSKLIILDKPIPGYNNVLTIAKRSMKFGVHKEVNRVIPKQITNNVKQITSNTLPKKTVSKLPVRKRPPPATTLVKKDPLKLTVKVPHKRTSHQDGRIVWGAIGMLAVGATVAFTLK